QEERAVGGAESPGGQAAGAAASGTITDPTMLSASDSMSLIGRSVQFSNLRVQNVIGDKLVVLDSGGSQPVYAVAAQGAGSIKPGDTVNVRGTVRSASAS